MSSNWATLTVSTQSAVFSQCWSVHKALENWISKTSISKIFISWQHIIILVQANVRFFYIYLFRISFTIPYVMTLHKPIYFVVLDHVVPPTRGLVIFIWNLGCVWGRCCCNQKLFWLFWWAWCLDRFGGQESVISLGCECATENGGWRQNIDSADRLLFLSGWLVEKQIVVWYFCLARSHFSRSVNLLYQFRPVPSIRLFEYRGLSMIACHSVWVGAASLGTRG